MKKMQLHEQKIIDVTPEEESTFLRMVKNVFQDLKNLMILVAILLIGFQAFGGSIVSGLDSVRRAAVVNLMTQEEKELIVATKQRAVLAEKEIEVKDSEVQKLEQEKKVLEAQKAQLAIKLANEEVAARKAEADAAVLAAAISLQSKKAAEYRAKLDSAILPESSWKEVVVNRYHRTKNSITGFFGKE